MAISIRRKESSEAQWKDHKKSVVKRLAKKWQNIRNRNSRRLKKRRLIDYLGGECSKCYFKTDVVEVYDFYYKDPSQKSFGITSATGLSASLERCKKEVDKCILLCKNCHAIEHYLVVQAVFDADYLEKIKEKTRITTEWPDDHVLRKMVIADTLVNVGKTLKVSPTTVSRRLLERGLGTKKSIMKDCEC